MNVWITGGAGFIGSALAKQLNTNGIKDIVIIDDLTNGEKFFIENTCEIKRGDNNALVEDVVKRKKKSYKLLQLYQSL